MADKFEELVAWQKARELCNAVYCLTLEGAFNRDFALRDQIRRAAISIMSNIAEGFERGGNRELCQFLYIAKGSAGEVRAQLYIAHDVGYITDEQFERLNDMTIKNSQLIAGFIRYIEKSDMKGSKYKE